MNEDIALQYPSTEYTGTSSKTRITPILVTIIVLIIIALLVYIILVWIESRNVKCAGPPSQPQNVIAGYVDATTFGIAWDKSSNADSYIVRMGEVRNFTPNQAIIQIETTDRRVNVSDLELSRTYYIRVNAVNSCGTSPDSLSITYIFVET